MHELSVCQALVEQLEDIAREHGAASIDRVVLRVGPLAGIEIPLLDHAYPVAAGGTVAENAELVIETMPIRVHCSQCDAESEATPSRLICAECGDFHTRLISGDEMLLASVELAVAQG